MLPLVYPDCLDGVRKDTDLESVSLTLAQIKFHLLVGQTPCLSQSQAFDSGHLLSYATDADFRDLVLRGDIALCLGEGAPGPEQVFCDSIQKPDFHLSAWSELEEADAADRKELNREIQSAHKERSDQIDTGIDALDERWNALVQLDRAYEQAASQRPQLFWNARAPKAGTTTLHAALEEVLTAAHDHPLRPYIQALVELRTSKRSLHHRFITSLADASDEEKAALHDIVNMRYNAIVAHSMHAAQALSGYSAAACDLVEAVEAVEHDSAPDGQQPLKAEEFLELEPLSWKTIREIRDLFRNPRLSFDRKWERLQRRGVFAAGQIVSGDREQQLALKLLPAAIPAYVAPLVSHIVSVGTIGPDGAAVANALLHDAQQHLPAPGRALRYTGVARVDAALNSRFMQRVCNPEEWMRATMQENYEAQTQARLLSLLHRGLACTLPIVAKHSGEAQQAL